MPKKKPKAPVVFNDSGHLGDRKLSYEGVAAKATEDTQRMSDVHRIANQDELEKQERSAGPRMLPSEFITRVKRETQSLLVQNGNLPGWVALSVYVEPSQREVGGEQEAFRYVGGFLWEPLPEFGHIITDEHGLPKREYRGWRSVLIGLVKNRVLTYKQAVRQFGEPIGPRGDQWFTALGKYK